MERSMFHADRLAGVWTEHLSPAGEPTWVEFGDEAHLRVRAFVGPGWDALRARGAEQRADLPATFDAETLLDVDGTRVSCVVGRHDDAVLVHLLADAGEVTVGLTLHDRSGQPADDVAAAALDALRAVDVDALRVRAKALSEAAPRLGPETLVPWLLGPDEPGVAASIVALANDVQVGVASYAPPFARLIVPRDPLLDGVDPLRLLALARMNLVRRMLADEVPVAIQQTAAGPVWVAGPHALAGALALLPDLEPWARGELGDGPLEAWLVRRDLLVIGPAGVFAADEGWAAPLPLLRHPP